jgi:sugar/nucleoside kinase (ribokinase family)
VEQLGVIGNISRDLAIYPGGIRVKILGGAALHVALAAARAGLPAAPISVIGTDLGWILGDPRLAAVDLQHVKVAPGRSCTFRLNYDKAGHMTSTEASFGVAARLTGHALSAVGSHSACHVCCRRPLDASVILRRLATAGVPYSVDFHLASASAVMPTARAALPHADTVFVNAAEFAILSQVTDPATLGTVVISDGPRPAKVLQHGQQVASAMPPTTTVAEVTGAGDTLAGTFLAASAQGMGWQAALREAVNAASQAVARPGLTIPVPGN